MNLFDNYLYSWFANLAYIDWTAGAIGESDTAGNIAILNAANTEANRVPGDPALGITTLGGRIFKSVAENGEGWRVKDFGSS